MGFFNRHNKEKRQENALGCDAIDNACDNLYPEPSGYVVDPKERNWGINTKLLSSICVYDGGDYYHFVTKGLTELYEKESNNKEISGYGMEFTFKLKKGEYDDESKEVDCVCFNLQQLASLTFNKGLLFRTYQHISIGKSLDYKKSSKITGFITIPDKELKPLDTTNGRVEFIEFVGITNDESSALKNNKIDVKTLYEKIGSDVTDYNRKSVI